MTRRRHPAPRSHRPRKPLGAVPALDCAELPADPEPDEQESEEQRRRDFAELLALARRPLVAAIDEPDRAGGIAWPDQDDPDAIPTRIPEDTSPTDLARRTWIRREQRRRKMMPPADRPTLPESSKQEGDGVFYEGPGRTRIVQRGLAASALASLRERFPDPPRPLRPTLRASGRPTASVLSRGSALVDGEYPSGGRRVIVQRGAARRALTSLRGNGAESRQVSEPLVAAAPPATEPTPADRLVSAIEAFLGREQSAPVINVSVPKAEPPTVNVQPLVRVDVPPAPKPRGVRVETDSHGRRHYIPIEEEEEK